MSHLRGFMLTGIPRQVQCRAKCLRTVPSASIWHVGGLRKEAEFLQGHKIPGSFGSALPKNKVIEDLDLQELPSADDVACHSDVGFGWTGIPERVWPHKFI